MWKPSEQTKYLRKIALALAIYQDCNLRVGGIRSYNRRCLPSHKNPLLHIYTFVLDETILSVGRRSTNRDGTGQISRDPRKKPHQTRRKRLAKPSKLTKVIHGPISSYPYRKRLQYSARESAHTRFLDFLSS